MAKNVGLRTKRKDNYSISCFFFFTFRVSIGDAEGGEGTERNRNSLAPMKGDWREGKKSNFFDFLII